MKNKYSILLFSILIIGCFLAGCKKTDSVSYDETTINIDKKGKVSETIVETFDKDYYDVDELKAEFTSVIDDYNESKGSNLVRLKDVKLDDSKVYVSIDFSSVDDYKELLNEDLYFGTINDAYDDGYKMDVTMKGIQNGDKIGKVEIMGMKDRQIVIVGEHVKIKVNEPIAYVSANVEVLSDKEARVLSESSGLAYLILEK